MKKLNQSGLMNPLVIPLVLSIIFLLVSFGLAVMYYLNYVEQRDNNEPLIAAAVADAKEAQQQELEKDFVEREKIPTKNYKSPSELGSVTLVYPKTWSAYVVKDKGAALDVSMHPNFVPSEGVNYALRMSVLNNSFASEVKKYDNEVKKGDLRATAVQAAGVTGTRLDGFLEKDKEGSMVVFPLRDKTLKVWTESKEFLPDYETIVLKNLSFVP